MLDLGCLLTISGCIDFMSKSPTGELHHTPGETGMDKDKRVENHLVTMQSKHLHFWLTLIWFEPGNNLHSHRFSRGVVAEVIPIIVGGLDRVIGGLTAEPANISARRFPFIALVFSLFFLPSFRSWV